MINIKGFDKAELLCALFNNSKVQGLGFLQSIDRDLTIKDAKKIIFTQGLYFDYLHGKVMKVNLSGDTLDERLYDRDNGDGTAFKAISELRAKKEKEILESLKIISEVPPISSSFTEEISKYLKQGFIISYQVKTGSVYPSYLITMKRNKVYAVYEISTFQYTNELFHCDILARLKKQIEEIENKEGK